MGDADSVLGPYQSWHHSKALPSTVHTGHRGDRSWHLGAFPKCLGKKPLPPLARAGSRDFPEEEFSPSLREVPLVWGVHRKWGGPLLSVPCRQLSQISMGRLFSMIRRDLRKTVNFRIFVRLHGKRSSMHSRF